MARVTLDKVQDVDSLEDLRRFTSKSFEALVTQFNGKTDFKDNIRADGPILVSFTSTNPKNITHGLGRTPVGIILLGQSAAGSVITPSKTVYLWSETQIFLQVSAPMNISIYVV